LKNQFKLKDQINLLKKLFILIYQKSDASLAILQSIILLDTTQSWSVFKQDTDCNLFKFVKVTLDYNLNWLLFFVLKGRLILLDLYAETAPQYQRYNSFFGHYYIWSMLHNFGGANGEFNSNQVRNE